MKNAKHRLTAFGCAAVMAMGAVALPLSSGLPVATAATQRSELFWDTSYSFEERAADLVSRLTLAEKATQLGNSTPAIPRLGIAKYGFWNEGLHGVANTKKGEGEFATSFPYSIAMAASWDPELIEAIGSASGDEARAYNNDGHRDLSYWCPTINMSRDPRWGRNHEGYGEDNFLTSQIAIGFINGYQGKNDTGVEKNADGTNKYLKVISTLKHYAANNSEYNREDGSSSVTNQYIREYFTRAFKDVIQGTNVNSVMSAYNMVNGVPSSGSYYLLDTLLRKTFGFNGYVVSDCGAIKIIAAPQNHYWKPSDWTNKVDALTGQQGLPDKNGLFVNGLNKDKYQPIDYTKFEDETGHFTDPGAVALCLAAGCDMDCGAIYPNNAQAAVNAGILDENTIDRSLVRIFTARMKTGEFDPKEEVTYRNGDKYQWSTQIGAKDAKEHNTLNKQLAEDSSTQSIVMMKNDAAKGESTPILPLSKDKKNVVMVGPLVQQNILGGYSGTPSDENLSTPQEGVEALLGQKVTYISGKSASNAYMPNLRKVTLKDKDGKVLSTLTPENVDSYTGCELDGTKNFRYIQPEAVISFKDVYMKDTALVELEIAGGDKALQGHIELHYGNVDGGVLADIKTVKTSGDTDYTVVSGFNSTGNYDQRDIHVVFHSDETTVSFTSAEQNTIKNADAVIVCIGGVNSAEGNDRNSIALWNSQDELVKQVATLNPRTVCHMQTVGVVEIGRFKDITPAILWTCNNGQAQGNALARVLFGEVNPSAKLPFTWYSYNSQLETIDDYDLQNDQYKYGGWTYQYFTGDVDYPFGHGLSYSTFAYSNLKLDTTSVTPDSTIKATVDVKNTSKVDGKETVELYVKAPNADGKDRPFKQLKAFEKVEIKAGETKTVELTLPLKNCYFWSEKDQKNVWDQGTYTVFVGPSSNEKDANAQTATFSLSGQPKDAISTVTAIPSGTKLNAAHPDLKLTTDLTVAMQDDTLLDQAALEKAGATVTYTTNRNGVVTVSKDGVVSPVGAGLVTITATVKLANGDTQSASYAVAVVDELTLLDLTVNGETVSGFAPSTTEYFIPIDGDKVPEVKYNAGGATAVLKNASAVPGDTTVTLTKDGKSVTYTIHFQKRSEDYVVASFSQMDGEYETKKSGDQLYADWKFADQISGSTKSVNFYTHNMSDLHLRATVTLSKPDDTISDAVAYGKGWLKLRSVEKNGENNAGWDLDKVDLGLKTGVNYIDIPLTTGLTTTKGTMDWAQVDRCIFVINTADLGGGYKMKLENVRVVDTSLGGERDKLWAAINDKFDTTKYTPESAEHYAAALADALETVLKDNLPEDTYKSKIQPLEDAKQHLEPLTYVVETFSQAARSFESYYKSDNDILGKNETLGSNWKQVDSPRLNAQGKRSQYYLQMTLRLDKKYAENDYPFAPKDAWKGLTIKLRSSSKSGVSGDPNGAENNEHNAGWDFVPSMLNREDPFGNGSGVEFTSADGGQTIRVSIPLDTPITNSRGIMQWDDIREIYINFNLQDAIRNEGGSNVSKEDADRVSELRKSHSYTMTIGEPRVVDMTYVNNQKQDLNALMSQSVEPSEKATAEQITAYAQALENAVTVYGTDFSTPFNVYDAHTALKAAIDAVTDGKGGTVNFADLDDAIEAVELDLVKSDYTQDSWNALQEVVAKAKALQNDPATTQRQVNDVLAELKEAQKALEYAPVDDPRHVRVNFTSIAGSYNVLVGGNTLWPDWTPGDGLTKDSQDGAGADLSGTAANGANKNLALYATAKLNVPEGKDSTKAWTQIKFRLRSSQKDKKEQAAKHYVLTPSQVTWNDDGSFSVKIALSDIVTENINWKDVKELHIECVVASEYQMPGQGNPTSDNISLTMSDVYIAADTVPLDTAALTDAIKAAEALVRADYTATSWKAFAAALEKANKLLTEAKSQARLDNAKTALEAAQKALALMGDLDGDGKIQAADALTALKAATGSVELTADQAVRANVDGKDGVTAVDALQILHRAAGKTAHFAD